MKDNISSTPRRSFLSCRFDILEYKNAFSFTQTAYTGIEVKRKKLAIRALLRYLLFFLRFCRQVCFFSWHCSATENVLVSLPKNVICINKYRSNATCFDVNRSNVTPPNFEQYRPFQPLVTVGKSSGNVKVFMCCATEYAGVRWCDRSVGTKTN